MTESISGDVRHAVRSLGRTPTFTATVLVTLAFAIGTSTAVFSVINGVILKPLPYPDAEALVGIWHGAPGIGTSQLQFSPAMYFTYRDENRVFQALGLWRSGVAAVTGVAEPEQVQVLRLTHGTLQALAIPPLFGRAFSPEDETPGTPDTVVLTYGYWQRRFGGDRSVIGRRIVVDSQPREVIGVMPRRFRFLDTNSELILPQRLDPARTSLGDFSYQGLARLKPGMTLADANADAARIVGIWLNAWPVPPGMARETFASFGVSPAIRRLNDEVVGPIGRVLWILMASVGMVLLIACANVANLLLVRTEARQRELAVRVALGASWMRIARALLIESTVLALVGGAMGVAVAFASLHVLLLASPVTLPRASEIGIEPMVLSFSIAVSLLSGVLVGAIPVFRYARRSPRNVTLRSSRTSSTTPNQDWLQRILVVAQVALAVVLLVASGLTIRTFQALHAVEPGFVRPAEVQLARVAIPNAQVPEPERVVRMQQEIQERMAAIPHVRVVSFTSSAPLEPFNTNDVLFVEGQTHRLDEAPPIRRYKFVAPEFFQTVGTPIVAGRGLTWADLYQYRTVALVSENLARELWGEPVFALGRRVRETPESPWREIIGVVGDVHDSGMNEPAPSIVYWPVLMKDFLRDPVSGQREVTFVIRSSESGTQTLLKEVRKAVWAVNPNLPLAQVRTLDDAYRQSLARTSFALVMLAIAAMISLVLACIGLYGVLSYTVTRRIGEIGIRMALGARPGQVQRAFVRKGVGLAGAGSACGVLAAIALTRGMQSLLFGVTPLDAATYVGVCLVLTAAAILASYMPARRAAAVTPIEALRLE